MVSSVVSVDADLTPWPDLELISRIEEGNRNEVWRARLGGEVVSVRRSRRSEASLDWELDFIADLAVAGLRVAEVVPTERGDRFHRGVVVQTWLDGGPPIDDDDWHAVAQVLHRVHRVGANRAQRPGCSTVTELTASSRSADADVGALPPDIAEEILSVFSEFGDVATSAIHGDSAPSNFRIDRSNGDVRVGLLDFDESRVDLRWHDFSNLGVQVLGDDDHRRAQRLSDAWEAVNAWVVEPDYAKRRLAALQTS